MPSEDSTTNAKAGITSVDDVEFTVEKEIRRPPKNKQHVSPSRGLNNSDSNISKYYKSGKSLANSSRPKSEIYSRMRASSYDGPQSLSDAHNSSNSTIENSSTSNGYLDHIRKHYCHDDSDATEKPYYPLHQYASASSISSSSSSHSWQSKYSRSTSSSSSSITITDSYDTDSLGSSSIQLRPKITVLITGITGFVASHIAYRLLRTDRYIVHGTVRDRWCKTKIRPLTKFYNAEENLRLFECDLLYDKNWDRAVAGCDYVIYVACPSSEPDEDGQLPAVEGVKRVFKACSEAGTVKRVVFTSSVAAISGGFQGKSRHCTEDEWSNPELCDPYCRSKTVAEKTAWELSSLYKFELVVLNPTMCIGPILIGETTSMRLIKRILEGGYPMLPRVYLPLVDVRDVADAHISALWAKNAPKNRIIVSQTNVWLKDIAKLIKDTFKPQGYKIKIRDMPEWALKLASQFNKSAKYVFSSISKIFTYDKVKMHEILGVPGRDVNKAIVDMCYSLIEKRLVARADKYIPNVSYLDDTELSFDNVIRDV